MTAENIGRHTPRSLGKPEEYGDVVAFLASERAAYITGSVIRVDGGMIPVSWNKFRSDHLGMTPALDEKTTAPSPA